MLKIGVNEMLDSCFIFAKFQREISSQFLGRECPRNMNNLEISDFSCLKSLKNVPIFKFATLVLESTITSDVHTW